MDTGDAGTAQFELTEDQLAIRDMADSFAAERVAPQALDWDKRKHFPADVIRETGPLGFGGAPLRGGDIPAALRSAVSTLC